MRIIVSRVAGRSLLRSQKRELIAQKIEALAIGPNAMQRNVKPLRGRSGFRLRVQDWRVLFRIEDGILYIDEIEPRGSAYGDRR